MLLGNGGQRILFSADDRYRLYLLLREGLARFGQRICGPYVMTNHLRLAVQVAEAPLSKIEQVIFCSVHSNCWVG